MTLSSSLKRYMSNSSHKAADSEKPANEQPLPAPIPGLTRTTSTLSKNDPLYEPDESENTPTGAVTAPSSNFSTLNLNQKSMPNDIQRQQRNQSFKKLPSNLNKMSIASSSSSSSSGAPLAIKHLCSSPLNKSTDSNIATSTLNNNVNLNFSFSKNSNCCSSSPIDIFERNVQHADISTDLSNSPLNNNYNNTSTNTSTLNEDIASTNSRPHSQSRSRSHSRSQSFTNINNSYILSNCRPRHLLSENYTSPVLDSTVELISSEKFDDTDVVEVPHARASQQLFKSHSHVSNSSISGSSSPRLSISRKYSNTTNSISAKNMVNLDHLQTSFSHNRSKSSLSNVSSPLINSKSEIQCTCNNNSSNAYANPVNADSPLVSPNRKSISFYSYLDLLNYERMSNNNPASNSPSPPHSNNDFLKRQNDIFDAQEEAEELRDLKNAQALENQLTGDLLTISCPKHGIMARRMAHQGCMEDGDAKIDEELNINSPKKDTASGSGGSPVYNVFNTSSSAIADDDNIDPNQEEDDDERDGSIQSWIPADNDFGRETSRSRSRRQSIVEEMASLKSCTTNNSYFEDELKECSTHDTASRIGTPVVNVCSANDYLSSRTRELRNSFVCNEPSLTPKKLLN